MSDQPWRRDYLGGSDAPSVVGVDPFRTAGDTWAVKTGRLPLEDEDAERGVSPRALGTALEPVLLDVAERRLDVVLARQVWYRHPTAPLACSVDGIALAARPPLLLEGKTCGILNRPAQLLTAYGDDGTDEVPESVLIQVTHDFVVLAAQPDLPPIRDAVVVALLGDGRGLRFYRLAFDETLGAELLDAEVDFWERYVVGDRRPPEPPSLPTLRALPRRPELATVPVDPAPVDAWLRAKAVLSEAEKQEELYRRLVLSELGDAEAGACALGTLTYRTVDRKGYTVAPTTVRQLRFKPTKEERGLPL
jgi:predicted phage-related endonuclease